MSAFKKHQFPGCTPVNQLHQTLWTWGLSIRVDDKPTPLCQNRSHAGPQGLQGTSPILPSMSASSLGSDKLQPRPATCLAAKQPSLQKEQRNPVRALIPTRRAGTQGCGPWPGGFCLLGTFHFYRRRTAAILPHRSCQRWGEWWWPSPRPLISQVPLWGMCLSLRVPVAAWKWTEAQRVTKRGSPCARLPAAPGLRKGYFLRRLQTI